MECKQGFQDTVIIMEVNWKCFMTGMHNVILAVPDFIQRLARVSLLKWTNHKSRISELHAATTRLNVWAIFTLCNHFVSAPLCDQQCLQCPQQGWRFLLAPYHRSQLLSPKPTAVTIAFGGAWRMSFVLLKGEKVVPFCQKRNVSAL